MFKFIGGCFRFSWASLKWFCKFTVWVFGAFFWLFGAMLRAMSWTLEKMAGASARPVPVTVPKQ